MMKAGVAKLSLGTAMLLLAACQPAPPPAPPPPPPPPPAPAPAPMAMPLPPNSAAATLVIPLLDSSGRRMTPNVDLSPEQALWQLRIGLNVAALSCRGPNETVLVANYTRFLNTNQAAIARAERWVIADQGRRNGTNGIAARDALSTRLYNYFAQPPVKTEFCIASERIMSLAAAEPTANILPFATTQIVALDQPFVNFYAAYARYQSDLALWRSLQPAVTAATQPGATQAGTSTPAPAASTPPPAAQPPRR